MERIALKLIFLFLVVVSACSASPTNTENVGLGESISQSKPLVDKSGHIVQMAGTVIRWRCCIRDRCKEKRVACRTVGQFFRDSCGRTFYVGTGCRLQLFYTMMKLCRKVNPSKKCAESKDVDEQCHPSVPRSVQQAFNKFTRKRKTCLVAEQSVSILQNDNWASKLFTRSVLKNNPQAAIVHFVLAKMFWEAQSVAAISARHHR